MQCVPPTHEQTPIRCSGCHTRFVTFVPAGEARSVHGVKDYVPDRCACGHLEERSTLPPGTLFSVRGESVKHYHPLTRPN
jgi:hypothetical protein